ncbi:MAG: ATP-binding cassette domain-containing protein [Candidatus Onthovivens sp.]|nr:ATP-binding cassette domain-containing protein [Candidatus Onthovivens sp.]
MKSLLKLHNICKKYNNINVINNLSFELPNKCIIGLIGENGCGKTTLMKCISQLISFEGNLEWNASKPGKTSYITDVPSFPPYMTGEEFLKFALDVINDNENKYTINEIFEKVNLGIYDKPEFDSK